MSLRDEKIKSLLGLNLESLSENELPLLKNRFVKEKTLIYVCVNKTCKMPVSEVNKAIELIK